MSDADLTGRPIRDGNVWRFPSGRTLPVVSGGSDVGAPVDLGAPAADSAPPVDAPPAAAPTANQPPDEVVRLRRENATWRARAQALEGLDDDNLAVLDPLLQAARSGDGLQIAQWIADQWNFIPPETRAQLRQQNMAPEQTGMPVGQQARSDDDAPMTRSEFQRALREEREAQRREQIEQAGRDRMMAEFREINVDPNSPLARAIATKVVQMGVDTGRRDVTLAEAHAALKAEWAPMFAPQAGAAPGSAAPGAPPVLPSGGATRDDNWANLTPKERAMQMASQLGNRNR